MEKLKSAAIDLSGGILNFLANIGLILPYLLIMAKYQQLHTTTLLIALVTFYISRSASIFYTQRLGLKSVTYLTLSLVLGAAGALIFASTTNFIWLVIGSLLWGYSAATIWPYFLTVKLHLKHYSHFKMKRLYWLIFGLLGLMVAADLGLHLAYTLSFGVLGLLYLAAIPGSLLLREPMRTVYPEMALHPEHTKAWRWGLSVIGFAIVALLTALRKTTLNLPTWLIYVAIAVAFIILILELAADWKTLPTFKLRLLNRGFIMTLVLLFNGFFAYFYLGKMGMYATFGIYLIGFELGHPLFTKLERRPLPGKFTLSELAAICGQVLLLIPWVGTYIVGLLLVTLYVGHDNPQVNENLYDLPELNADSAIIRKYRFSTYGGLLCQLALFTLLVTASTYAHTDLLAFFNPHSAADFNLYFYSLSWPLTLVSLGLTALHLSQKSPHK